MIIEALDYAGARTAAGGFADGVIFQMAYRELINSIRCVNAEPRYSFGYQTAKGVVTQASLEISKNLSYEDQGLTTEHWEFLFGELGEALAPEGELVLKPADNLDFGGLVPYRVARVYDRQGDYARADRADVIRDRELSRNSGFRQFSFNQDREDFAILELSRVPSGELTVIAEKQIEEPDGIDGEMDLPKNVYKFLMSWLSRSLCRRLGNAEMEALAASELSSNEKPFLATNERNKRDYRINPHLAYERLGQGGWSYARRY
jgi:hypothetical protein